MAANASKNGSTPAYTVPGMSTSDGRDVIQLLRMRLHALNDLALTLKHVHWNVVGPHFIAVHEMLDPQVEAVREMIDNTAERISTLGGSPCGTPGALSPNAPGTTTPSAAPRPSNTWAPSTSSTPESSRTTARPSRPPRRTTRSPRTC